MEIPMALLASPKTVCYPVAPAFPPIGAARWHNPYCQFQLLPFPPPAPPPGDRPGC